MNLPPFHFQQFLHPRQFDDAQIPWQLIQQHVNGVAFYLQPPVSVLPGQFSRPLQKSIAQSPNCPAPGPGQYCATVAGQVVTVTLGSKVTVSLTNVGITFAADAPASSGTGAFASTVDDSATAGGPQPTSAGDAAGRA